MRFFRRPQYWLLLIVVLFGFAGSVISSFITPQKAAAAGETYRWMDYNTLRISGGDTTGGPWDFKLNNPSNNLPGTPQVFSNAGEYERSPVHKSGCNLTFKIAITGNNTGSIDFPGPSSSSSSSANDPRYVYCWASHEECVLWIFSCDQVPSYPGVRESYDGKSISIQGNRPGPGEVSETEGERAVTITIKSPRVSSASPDTMTMEIRKGGQPITTATADKTTDIEEDLKDGHYEDPPNQPVKYTATFHLDPGDYQVCDRVQVPQAPVIDCQSFTKIKYDSLSLTFGQFNNKSITGEVTITFNGSAVPSQYQPSTTDTEMPLGPIELTIEKPGDTGFAKKTITTTPKTITLHVADNPSNVNYTGTIQGVFANIEPGTYKVCVPSIGQCKDVTKVANEGVKVSFDVDSATGNILVAGGSTSGTDTRDPCSQNAGGFGWLICPMTSMFQTAAGWVDEQITTLLKVNACRIFHTTGSTMSDCEDSVNEQKSSDAFYAAWKVFRTMAYALLVILGLIMVVSQIAGLELLDAYAIRKMLPKLVLATIFIPLLWPLLKIVTVMANNSADAVSELIKAPFMFLQHDPTIGDWFVGGGLSIGAIVGAGTVLFIGGSGFLMALVGTILLSLAQALVVISARDMVFFLLVLLSPLAVVLGIFGPFQKAFSLWRRFLTGILLSIPTVAAVLAASKVAAALSSIAHPQLGIFFALIFIVVGYMLFWPILKSMDKVAGQIDGFADKATSGAQKALAKYRGETMKRRWHEYKEGRRGSLERPGSIFNPASWAKRAANFANNMEDNARPGLKSRFTKLGKAQREALKHARHERESLALKEEAAKFGESFSGNSQLTQTWTDVGARRKGESEEAYKRRIEKDRLKKLRQRTINDARAEGRRSIARGDEESDEDFERRAKKEGNDRAAKAKAEWDARTNEGYEKKKKETIEEFWEESASMAAQAGVEMGSEQFRLLAARSAMSDSTAYRSDDFESVEAADQAAAKSLARMVSEGLIDPVMATKMYNSNKERADRAAGFGQNMGYIAGLTPDKIDKGIQAIIAEAQKTPNGDLAHIAELATKGDQEALAEAAEKEYIRRHQRKQSAATTRGNSINQVYAQRHEATQERAQDDARVARMLSHIQDLTTMGDHPDLKRVREMATELGVPHDDITDTYYDASSDTDAAHRIQERLVARIKSDMAAREDLAFDRTNFQRSPVQAQLRHLARLSGARQSMLQYAPQNRDIVDAEFQSQRIKIPTSKPAIRTTIDRDGNVIPVLDEAGKPVIATERRVVRVPTERKEAILNPATGAYDYRTAMEWVDPSDPSKGQRPETREEVRQVPILELRLDPGDKEMTVLEALERVKEDPLLAEEMRKPGYDYELAQARRAGAPIDPAAIAGAPTSPPTGPPTGVPMGPP